MDFVSAEFLGYLAVLAVLHAVLPRGWRCALLVAGSYLFYWQSSGWLAVLLFGATMLAFVAARAAEVFAILDRSFMAAPQPGLIGLMARGGPPIRPSFRRSSGGRSSGHRAFCRR